MNERNRQLISYTLFKKKLTVLILGDIFIRPQQILCFLDFSGRKFYYKKKIYAFSTDKKKINILNSVYVHALKRKQSAK